MPKYDRKQLMHRVQIAIGELHLSSWTQADKKRLHYVESGMIALDEEQSLIKTGIEELLEEFAKNKPLEDEVALRPDGASATDILIEGLQKLVKEQRPRVTYPDRKLLEPPKTKK